ncbi:transmembrane protein 85 [Echinococcus multilocularis]|uniref:ER membrane protein complex subunit 4 n=1 Tax=Echinococcus multilocularis TaxID=6211 RepID=A0A068Y985_ECHMU|nr:transmembrane protein 85 [Echinococcus multilocularis]
MNSLKTLNKSASDSVELTKLVSKRWNVDFNSRSRIGLTSNGPCDQSLQPIGFSDRTFPHSEAREQDPQLKIKRSWDVALGPLRQIPMNLFIMWMTGNSISIFPIIMVYMMFTRPLQVLFSMQTTLQMIEGEQAPIQCLVFILGNLLMVAMAIYKCHNMGLLPTYASDWLSFIQPSQRAEWSVGGFIWW